MTVQAGIEVEMDLEVLVGEFEELSCESDTHDLHQEGPATHYAHVKCDCGVDLIKAYCEYMVNLVNRNVLLGCFNCIKIGPAQDHVAILGPINSSTR